MATPASRPRYDPPTEDPPTVDLFEDLLHEAARIDTPPDPRNVPLHVGQRLCDGRFELLRCIGAGGSGVVYAAFDEQRGERVALKALTRPEPRSIYGLKNEFRGAARICHPNLVRLHGLFADAGEWLLTMELIAGEPFDLHVRPGGRLHIARLRAALPQLVSAVSAIHAAGKLHRDLKPSNVLVTAEGRVVVLDFGLVSTLDRGGAGCTVDDGLIHGTPVYMSPEQASGEPMHAASDWYAVGVMLYEALCGDLPFDGPTPTVLDRKQRCQPPPLPEGVRTPWPELSALCVALLRRDPAERPSVDELRARMGAMRAGPASGGLAAVARLWGRDDALQLVQAVATRSAGGTPTVLSVSGEPGVGKTALCEAVLDALEADADTVVLRGRIEQREAVPYRAFDAIVDELARHLRRLGGSGAAALMPRDVAELARIFPALNRVDCVASAPLRPVPSPGVARQRAFAALTELLARIRDRGPLVLFVDDMQWADADSLRLLQHMLVEPDPAPLMLVFAFSTAEDEAPGCPAAIEERIETAALSHPQLAHHALHLTPLAEADAEALCRELLRAQAVECHAAEIAREAGGNPMLIRHLCGHVLQQRRAGALDGNPQWGGALRAQLQGLSPLAAETLELLAVAGRPLPQAMLAGLLEASGSQLHAALEALGDAQLAAAGGERVACSHPRIASAVCEALDVRTVRGHHRALALAYEGQAHVDPELPLRHRRAAGDRAEAGRHAVAAAERALRGLALERAAALYTEALAELPAAEADALGLRARQAEVLSMAGRWFDAAQAFDAAARVANSADEQQELSRRSAVHALGSGHASALPALRSSLQRDGVAWPRTRIGALMSAVWRLAWLRLRLGFGWRPAPAMPEPRVEARLQRLVDAAIMVPPHDFARGAHFVSLATSQALSHGGAGARAFALAMLSVVLVTQRGGRRLSQRLAGEAVEAGRDSADRSALGAVALSIAALQRMHAGALRVALQLTDEALSHLRRLPSPRAYDAWAARQVRACTLLLLGRADEAAMGFFEAANGASDLGDGSGGDAVLRHLVLDDLPAARALLAHKRAVLGPKAGAGTLGQVLAFETLVYALYAGEAVPAAGWPWQRQPGLDDFLQLDALRAASAMHAARGPLARLRCRLRLSVVIRRYSGQADAPAHRAMAAQLRAVGARCAGDMAATRAALAEASERYLTADMPMHAHVVQLRAAQLGDVADPTAAATARNALSAAGIRNPDAWARVIAPGL